MFGVYTLTLNQKPKTLNMHPVFKRWATSSDIIIRHHAHPTSKRFGFRVQSYVITRIPHPSVLAALKRMHVHTHLLASFCDSREGQWRECESFDEMSAEADDGERGRVVSSLLDWIQEGKGGVVSLHGSQFVGKTSVASRVAIRASMMMSNLSGNGTNPVVALCFAGGMAGPEVVDYLRREISLLWKGGASLIHKPSTAIRQTSDILPEVRDV